MIVMRFTARPWRVDRTPEGFFCVRGPTDMVAGTYLDGNQEANPHLIAAAPEMYALIEAFRETAAALLEGDTAEAWVSDCDQILAKARGEP